MKPKDFLEFHYEGVTICMNAVKQVMILFEPVGSTYMYGVYVVDRGSSGPLLEDDISRTWSRGPGLAGSTGTFNFYGSALQTARGICGWAWEPHPDSHLIVKHEQLEEDARQADIEEEVEELIYYNDPSLTASERNPSLTKRR